MDRGKGKAPDASFIPSQPETPAPEWELPDDGEGGFHAVEPKLDCPHINSAAAMAPLRENMVLSVDQPCSMCGTGPENWFCLKCHQVFCSRYVHGHGVQHFNESRHPLAISFSDLSTWCHACNEYVENRVALRPYKTALYVSKFGVMPPDAIAGSGGLDFRDID